MSVFVVVYLCYVVGLCLVVVAAAMAMSSIVGLGWG